MTAPSVARRRVLEAKQETFGRYLGIEFTKMEGGECEARLAIKSHHKNLGGVVHGGVIASLLDSCMGGAVVSTLDELEWCGTTQLDTKFLRWADGPTLVATGRVVKRGRQVAFVEGSLRDAGGLELARASGVWYVWAEGTGPQLRPAEGA